MSRSKLAGIIFAAAILAVAPPVFSGPSEEPNSSVSLVDRQVKTIDVNAPYIIGAQNMIQIKVFGEADTNQVYRVDEMGFIKHALLGRIKIAGLTVEEVERTLEQKLSGDYLINPKVNVFVLEHSVFSILGEVRRPGNYELAGGRVSIIKALSLAGGFTPVANQRGVKVIRRGADGVETSFQVDTTRITDRGDLSGQTYLQADDVIVVPKSFF